MKSGDGVHSLSSMADTATVYVIDRVVTKPGQARVFVDRYLAEYAPGARSRGMTLERVLVSPPIWFDDRSNTVTVTWSLPDPQAWWQMTWRAGRIRHWANGGRRSANWWRNGPGRWRLRPTMSTSCARGDCHVQRDTSGRRHRR